MIKASRAAGMSSLVEWNKTRIKTHWVGAMHAETTLIWKISQKIHLAVNKPSVYSPFHSYDFWIHDHCSWQISQRCECSSALNVLNFWAILLSYALSYIDKTQNPWKKKSLKCWTVLFLSFVSNTMYTLLPLCLCLGISNF